LDSAILAMTAVKGGCEVIGPEAFVGISFLARTLAHERYDALARRRFRYSYGCFREPKSVRI
jgi:hypothetical protein